MKLLLFLLCALPVSAQAPVSASWTETPVPHWTCPAGFYLDRESVRCFHVPARANVIQYDPNLQEEIHWGWVKIVPDSGVLRIGYPPEMIRPGCEVIDKTDEATNRMRFSDESKSGFTIHAKPRHKLHLNCKGVITRLEPLPGTPK